MSWLSYQRALRGVLLDQEPSAAAFDTLGADPRWKAYRRMVRSRFYETIDHGFERLIGAIGVDRFHRVVDRFLVQSPPRSPYLRDLPGELLRFVEQNASSLNRTHDLPPYTVDLMRYEWAELDTAYDHEEAGADDVGPFDMHAIAVLSPAHRLLDLDYRVHEMGAAGQDAPAERSPVSLCVYRDRKTHEVETLELSGTAPRILRGMARREAPLAEVAQSAAAGHGVTIDVAFVEALSTLLANLVERGVLLGSVRPREKMTMNPSSRFLVIATVATTAFACSKDQSADKHVAAAAAPAASAVAGQKKIPITAGTATFLIDAPLEKIKGRSGKVRGALNIDPQNLKASTGQIEVDLDDLHTETFQDENKNKTQTEHARNWLEIGPDVDAKRHEENRWARFTIQSIQEASAVKLASAGDAPITLQANGEFWLHGATAPKTVAASVTFSGPPEAPTSVHIVTTQPVTVSLKQHDVKPRDLAGKFIAGAFEKIGQKIDDTVQISLDLTGG